MSNNAQAAGGGGIGFCGLLTVLFIALKLTGVIAWSWWWVLAPLWVPPAIILYIVATAFIALTASNRLRARNARRRMALDEARKRGNYVNGMPRP